MNAHPCTSLSWIGSALVAAALALTAAPCLAAKGKIPDKKAAATPAKPGGKPAQAAPVAQGAGAAYKEISAPQRRPVNVSPCDNKEAVSAHGPYASGDCSICHAKNDPKDPGPAQKPVNKVCFSCHDEFPDLFASLKNRHIVAEENCTNCHNPHNSKQAHLLVSRPPVLCVGCHTKIKDKMQARVQHGALTQGASCVNCHNPHASKVEKLLIAMPFDLCVNCHSKDDITDGEGKKLANFKMLLDGNPVHHAPVADKDCSACHQPHGGDNFRLLGDFYPSHFYAPFNPENYALCFECHDSKMINTKETTTATRFRNGTRNLHYVHVNKPDRGRTCRACHEVHASKQPFQVRDSVPFGSKGWLLQVNFKKNADGGTCDKTCHTAKSYVNAAKAAVNTQAAP